LWDDPEQEACTLVRPKEELFDISDESEEEEVRRRKKEIKKS
jgi:hypothetical protein